MRRLNINRRVSRAERVYRDQESLLCLQESRTATFSRISGKPGERRREGGLRQSSRYSYAIIFVANNNLANEINSTLGHVRAFRREISVDDTRGRPRRATYTSVRTLDYVQIA